MTHDARVYVWGQCWDLRVPTPRLTPFRSINDAFASFSSPSVTWSPISVDVRPRDDVLDSLKAAFDNPERSDIRVLVEGRIINAHKSFLEIRCRYFHSLFAHRNAPRNNVEVRPSYPYDIYHAFLRYLYTGELRPDIEIAIGLFDVAAEYGEPQLKRDCEKVIARGITVENAGRLYAVAIKYGAEDLEDFCFRFCVNHLTSVAVTDAFRRLDEGVMKNFIEKAAYTGAFRR
ncbi:unnamed protein product [Darwinula stevensoni]|uniref:BTB domain-containing protein n=1 Tax=Darwinula stevensoni TaxID=69355 RepID=A0A7R9ABM2_9CRUS|nr:unnamed protein product [Darwinula stevensoni]CAG0899570.1 unnamed protein product [Darwinula stevensoni]